MDAIKVFISFVFSSFIAMISPLFTPIIILVWLLAFDIIVGIISDRVINKTGFSTNKFLKSVFFLCLYLMIIASMYIVCHLLHDVEEGLVMLKIITYVCSYFYLSNILKNLHESFPKNRIFSFLLFVLSVDILTKKIPVLDRFLNFEKEETKNENNNENKQ